RPRYRPHPPRRAALSAGLFPAAPEDRGGGAGIPAAGGGGQGGQALPPGFWPRPRLSHPRSLRGQAMSFYRAVVRPLLHRVKRFRNFVRDLAAVIARGWDLRLITACDMKIHKLPKTTEFWHPVGIVIGGRARIGENCVIRQNDTIGHVCDQYHIISYRMYRVVCANI